MRARWIRTVAGLFIVGSATAHPIRSTVNDALQESASRIKVESVREPAAGHALVILRVEEEEPGLPGTLQALNHVISRRLEALGYHAVDVRVQGPAAPAPVAVDAYGFPEPAPPPAATQKDTGAPPARAPRALPAPSDPVLAAMAAAGPARPEGFLTDKWVFLNPGHGWVWRSGSTWGLQRTLTNNIIEDFSNVELISRWLSEYVRCAGGRVVSARELCQNPNMIIVDNQDGTSAPDNGTYEEYGPWYASSLKGYAGGCGPFDNGTNPFDQGSNRLVNISNSVTAYACWTPNIPEDGYYTVYVSYSAYSARASNAHYVVNHTGGGSAFYVNQKVHGATWLELDRFYFRAGLNTNTGSVMLFNDSADATALNVSADAVRFGGGTGMIRRNASLSGQARFEEDARYHIQFNGIASNQYDFAGSTDEEDSWTARLRYFGIFHETGEDACSVSLHSNAGGGTGTRTYVHNTNPGPSATEYRDFIHNEITNAIKALYDPAWTGSKQSGSYGENNAANAYNEMPVLLVEYAFHDHDAKDSKYIKDPAFRRLLARSTYQGMARYFAWTNGTTAVFVPEPPASFSVQAVSATNVMLAWQPPPYVSGDYLGHTASSYRIYRSLNGYGFDNGTAVAGLSYTATVPFATAVYFRITAVNAGGESFPTETLVGRTAGDDEPRFLFVNGFDKIDSSGMVRESQSGGTVHREHRERVNTGNYSIPHALALQAGSYRDAAVDSCARRAVASNRVSLADYDAVIWAAGLQSEAQTFDIVTNTCLVASEKAAIQDFLNGGGRLLITGSEIAWDLDRSTPDPFARNYLKATYVADNAGTNAVQARGAGVMGHQGGYVFDNGGSNVYPVYWPDRIAATNGAVAALVYGWSHTVGDAFNAIGGWWDPNSSGQTVADAASSFSIVTNVFWSTNSSGRLYYLWSAGGYIREYSSSLPTLPSDSMLSLYVYGDAGGNELSLCVRDAADNDLFLGRWHTVDWNGWREIAWDLHGAEWDIWVQNGDGTMSGSSARFDSVHLRQAGALEGALYFDDLSWYAPSTGAAVAAVASLSTGRVFYAGFPLETVHPAEARARLLNGALDFLLGDIEIEASLSQATNHLLAWSSPAGLAYDVQGKTNLTDGNWTALPDATNLPPGVSGTRAWPATSTNTAAYYRIRAALR